MCRCRLKKKKKTVVRNELYKWTSGVLLEYSSLPWDNKGGKSVEDRVWIYCANTNYVYIRSTGIKMDLLQTTEWGEILMMNVVRSADVKLWRTDVITVAPLHFLHCKGLRGMINACWFVWRCGWRESLMKLTIIIISAWSISSGCLESVHFANTKKKFKEKLTLHLNE